MQVIAYEKKIEVVREIFSDGCENFKKSNEEAELMQQRDDQRNETT